MIETTLNGKTKNIKEENIKQLKQIFPEIVTEDKIDFDKLREILGEEIDDNNERYDFTWKGKHEAVKISQTPSEGTLRPNKEDSKNWNTTENLYIEGDNLEVLKLLQKPYYGKIKMIYLDPPYNTGKDFVYEDDFTDNLKNYLDQDEEGFNISSNPETSGRYHTKWLNMIYPRIKLARNLLTDDGVIFISIDDTEVVNLRKVCDEIFGVENYINLINIKSKASSGASGGGEDKRLKKNIEYLLVYTKSNQFKSFNPVYKNQDLIEYIEERRKENKSFAYTKILIDEGSEEYIGETIDGSGNPIELYNVKNFNIKSVNQVMKEQNLSEREIYYKYYDKIFTTENAQTSIRTRVKDATSDEYEYVIAKYVPISGRNKGKKIGVGFIGSTRRLVSFLSNVAEKDDEKVIKKDKIGTLWDDMSWSSTHLEGGLKFNNGKKPVNLIKRILNMQNGSEYIALDFFSGSATTAHAVMDYNNEYKTNLKFIMVQLPEKIPKKDEKLYPGLKNICEIGKERIRRAGDKLLEENPNTDIDIGFKVFKLDSSNLTKWNPDVDNLENSLIATTDNIVKGRTELDLVYEIMLKYGVELTSDVEEVVFDNYTFYSVNMGSLIICLNDNIKRDIAEDVLKIKKDKSPDIMRVVFKDNGFNSDSDKTNVKEILRNNEVDEFITM